MWWGTDSSSPLFCSRRTPNGLRGRCPHLWVSSMNTNTTLNTLLVRIAYAESGDCAPARRTDQASTGAVSSRAIHDSVPASW